MNGSGAGWTPPGQPGPDGITGPRNPPAPAQPGPHQRPAANPPFPGLPTEAGHTQHLRPQQPWLQQQQWPIPPKKRGSWPWIAAAVGLITVIALAVAVGVQWGRSHDNSPGAAAPNAPSAAASDVASANDHAAIGIITDDPSCGPWGPINDNLAAATQQARWDSRDEGVPAVDWTPDMRTIFESSAKAFGKAADQTLPLIKITTHRVMRELYQQFVAYLRAWIDRVPSYTPPDMNIIRTGVTAGLVLNGICQAITFRSALTRGPMVPVGPPPTQFAPVGDVNNPTRFIAAPYPGCADWNRLTDDFDHDPALAAWKRQDSNVPASSWTPEYQAANDVARPVLARYAETAERLGRQASNPIIEDFGVLFAQYERAFAAGTSTYTQPDNYLFTTFRRGLGFMSSACNAVGSR